MGFHEDVSVEPMAALDDLPQQWRVPGLTIKAVLRFKGLLVPIVTVALWEILSAAGLIPQNWLPAPSAIVTTLLDLWRNGDLPRHIAATIARVGAGFLLGALGGTLLGGITGSSRTARELLDPTIQALRNIPSMAWVPLFLLWLGIHESSKIALIAVGVFFPVYLNLLEGIRAVDRRLVEVGEVFRLGRLALPSYLVGLRSGLGLGWMFVVAAELMGASRGLGFLMVDGQMTGRASVIIASIVLFALFGKLTDTLIESVGRIVPGATKNG
jgi:sulfonate transport system permease protein